MADTKVSELTTATSTGGSDLLYLVQSNTSKKVTLATLFANASNVSLKGNVNLDTSVQTLTTPGTIDNKKQITRLSADAVGGALSINAGTDSQIKVILLTSTAGGTYTLSGNIANNANIVFSVVGHTATLLYTSSKWFMIGGTATLT